MTFHKRGENWCEFDLKPTSNIEKHAGKHFWWTSIFKQLEVNSWGLCVVSVFTLMPLAENRNVSKGRIWGFFSVFKKKDFERKSCLL